jgi:hypothetical protein
MQVAKSARDLELQLGALLAANAVEVRVEPSAMAARAKAVAMRIMVVSFGWLLPDHRRGMPGHCRTSTGK